MQVSDLKTIIAAYLGRTTSADLIQDGQDLGLAGLNSAARKAQQAHDFKAAEIDVLLSIASSGGALSSAVSQANLFGVSVTGTLNPNVVGSFAYIGVFGVNSLYWKNASGTDYFLASNGASWAISTNFVNRGSNYWILTTTSPSPNGTYTAVGSYTGSPIVANASVSVAVKRVKFVSLPLNSSEYEPIEFLEYEEFSSRVRRRIGRQPFNPTKTLTQLGASLSVNPIAYQSAQSLFLFPSTLPFPITAKLLAVQWMPLYAQDTDHDFFTDYGTEYMYWQGILETNNFWKRYTEPRIEGQVDVNTIQALANDCLQRLIAWDVSIARNTTTPLAQLTPPAFSTTPPQAQQ